MTSTFEQAQQDEGYSEDPLSNSTSMVPTPPKWLANIPLPERTEYVMSIIDQLPTSQVAEIVRRLRPRLYINFFQTLPPEVCLKVLGYLEPRSLINTARASREWMLLALDRKLWEQLYILEGFRVIPSEVKAFEESLNKERRPSGQVDDGHTSKRRATPQRILPSLEADIDFEMVDAAMADHNPESIFGGAIKKEPVSFTSDSDVPMMSAETSWSSKMAQFAPRPASTFQERLTRRLSTGSTLAPPRTLPLINMSSLVVLDRGDNKKKLNWQYLYSQRRRLEANWEAEKYTNFQLPHPEHMDEAHEECIYTIQHSGKYLVSGSRDRTLRIWDLDTRRLLHSPLRAHNGSVLCLQFDADPEEDLIVSGSSDATVVLWQFSTGKIIQRLRKAHRESVLNVRFDKHVLVTCSKDKTIKIFNRRPLNAGDLSYSTLSGGVNPVPTYLNNYGFNPSPTAGLPTKPAYTMIGILEGHGAAVNAVQIHGNEVVSASGDRTVKVWNWPEQTCIRTLTGHMKGIACVQYDGRRIVSGSSDNEVKVFDKESGLEVASLRAHTNLVRTVQAGFGDLPYSAEEDKEAAKAIDHEYFRALDSGVVSRSLYAKRGRPRNAGSRKPEDIIAYGAQLPPGGGGGKYGRIVSGSYDETIIIWRRDKEGVWRAQHTLRQEEAAHNALTTTQDSRRNGESVSTRRSLPSPQAQEPSVTTLDDAPTMPFAPGSDSFYRHLISVSIGQGPVALRHALGAHPQLLRFDYLAQAIATQTPEIQEAMQSVVEAVTQVQDTRQTAIPRSQMSRLSQQHPLAQAQTSRPSTFAEASSSHEQVQEPIQETASQAATHPPMTLQHLPVVTPVAQTAPPAPQTAQLAAQPAAPQGHNHAPRDHLPTNMARVFKLQFDARRIICCSQTSVIVGWDFANGDEQIIEASRFFAPVE